MSKLSASVAGLWLGAAGAVWAQAAAPASGASQAAKPPLTEAQAAMERAQRLAANPMKVILQASKIRRRPNEPEPEVADPNILRRTAVRTEAAPTAPAPAPVVTAPAAAPAAPPPAEPVVVNKFMPSALAGGTATSVPALEAALPAATAPAMSKAVAPAALPIAPLAVQPTLVTMVDPEIPVRLMADGNRIKEVFADLQLRPDGTVADVKLVPPVPRGWQSYIISALERWRFEPLAAARLHRVQLVFEER